MLCCIVIVIRQSSQVPLNTLHPDIQSASQLVRSQGCEEGVTACRNANVLTLGGPWEFTFGEKVAVQTGANNQAWLLKQVRTSKGLPCCSGLKGCVVWKV
jgi:hypothetical protein